MEASHSEFVSKGAFNSTHPFLCHCDSELEHACIICVEKKNQFNGVYKMRRSSHKILLTNWLTSKLTLRRGKKNQPFGGL